MRQEELRDTAEILSNILNQPLDVKGASQPQVSLLGAVLNYENQAPLDSDLCKILQALTKYKEPTETLIQELELLSRDLS